jgi:integrase/recombinase XerD
MPDSVYDLILSNSLTVTSFERVRAYALVLLCIKCSCRTKEIRLAKVSDLDTERWILHIAHPKGEDTYGDPRDVAVHPDIRPIVMRYLAFLKERSHGSAALFPSSTSRDGHLSENSLRRFKALVETDVGFRFDFRMCRRTFGQQLLDSGIDIETVSVLMGHRTTKTTEISYARRRNTQANERLVNSWS